MQLQHLSQQDAITLLEIIHDCLACPSSAEAVELMSRLDQLLPYEAALSCIRRSAADSCSMEVVNVDYPTSYLTMLGERKLIPHDPIVRENFRNFRLQYWAETFEKTSWNAEIDEIISLAEDFGFRKVSEGCGYGHGVSNAQGTESSLFCYHGLERDPRTEEILSLAIPHFHAMLFQTGQICSDPPP